MHTQDVQITIRVNRELKESAETLFDCLGLNMSNAINIFLRKAVDQRGIPFTVNNGNQGFGEMNSEKITRIFNNAVNQDIERKIKKDLPVARYDTELRKAYLENADGTREYV